MQIFHTQTQTAGNKFLGKLKNPKNVCSTFNFNQLRRSSLAFQHTKDVTNKHTGRRRNGCTNTRHTEKRAPGSSSAARLAMKWPGPILPTTTGRPATRRHGPAEEKKTLSATSGQRRQQRPKANIRMKRKAKEDAR